MVFEVDGFHQIRIQTCFFNRLNNVYLAQLRETLCNDDPVYFSTFDGVCDCLQSFATPKLTASPNKSHTGNFLHIVG